MRGVSESKGSQSENIKSITSEWMQAHTKIKQGVKYKLTEIPSINAKHSNQFSILEENSEHEEENYMNVQAMTKQGLKVKDNIACNVDETPQDALDEIMTACVQDTRVADRDVKTSEMWEELCEIKNQKQRQQGI